MPHYCKKERKSFTITNQDAVLYPVYKETEDGENYAGRELKLPGIRHRLRLPNIPEDAKLREVKVCPWYGKYMLILVMETEEVPVSKERPYVAGVDLGTDNIAAIVTTDHASRVYKGGAVLSENRLFHKERAKAVSILTKGTGKQNAHSRHLDFLSRKHDCFTRDVMHKISADIVRFCEEHRAGTIVIGTNPLWKQRVNMGRANNQKFMSVPHTILRRMITYKAEAAGITVVLQEESYTSKADVTAKDRMPVYGKAEEKPAFSGRREGRGLYRCQGGLVINADCNGAANILRKAIPEAWNETYDFRFLAYPESVTFRRLNRHRAAV
jgi:putative transposase